METQQQQQQPRPSYVHPPTYSPAPTAPSKPVGSTQPAMMDVDMPTSDDDERTQRAASVLSGMSMEDMEAAETLNSLHAKFHPPLQSHPPPTHLQTTTSYDSSSQPEPLLSLLTSQHPLAASLINGSLSAYRSTQAYIPGAYFVEQNVGLPIAGTIGRVTGVEGGIRWALQSKRESMDRSPSGRREAPNGMIHASEPTDEVVVADVEKALPNGSQTRRSSRSSGLSFTDPLPAYDDSGRSPPYQEQQLVFQSRERQPPPGWRTQLMISTSGLGVAMSEESLRSLRYCLSWLRWANGRLGGAIQSLSELLRAWDEGKPEAAENSPHVARHIRNGLGGSEEESHMERSQAVLVARIASLKVDVLQTLKQVVDVVSKYAGGALPENARNLVRRHLTSLPQRFSIASAMVSNSENGNANEAASSAHRVMVLAQEGLDMMSQVSGVVNGTLVSAEGWCEKLGRRRKEPERQQGLMVGFKPEEERRSSMTLGRDGENTDVKMEM